MQTYYKSEVNYKNGNLTTLNIDLFGIQVFDDEMCERFIERIKKEIKNARAETVQYEQLEELTGELKKTYESKSNHRLKKENQLLQDSLKVFHEEEV